MDAIDLTIEVTTFQQQLHDLQCNNHLDICCINNPEVDQSTLCELECCPEVLATYGMAMKVLQDFKNNLLFSVGIPRCPIVRPGKLSH